MTRHASQISPLLTDARKVEGHISCIAIYCVQKAVCRLADEHKDIKNQLLLRTNSSNAQK